MAEESLDELLDRVRLSACGVELRQIFLRTLARLRVKYCSVIGVVDSGDGLAMGETIFQRLPVGHGLEHFIANSQRVTRALESLAHRSTPLEIDASSVAALGEEWSEAFFEARDSLAVEWCLVVPVVQAAKLRSVGLFFSEVGLSPHAIEWLFTLSQHGYAKLVALGLAPSSPPPASPLTPRQRDVLVHCAQGKSDWEIAQLLGISAVTAHEHV